MNINDLDHVTIFGMIKNDLMDIKAFEAWVNHQNQEGYDEGYWEGRNDEYDLGMLDGEQNDS